MELNKNGFGDGSTGEIVARSLIVSLREIEKMDAILKIKANEEKKAKLSRIQTEEESREILNKLSLPKRPKGIKENREQFMKLLNDFAKIKEDDPSCLELSDVTEQEKDEKNVKVENKKEKIRCQQPNKNNLPFVEKNILLAKCGGGTLSLTDEEKCRIENLLVDIEDFESKVCTKTQKGRETLKTGLQKEEFYAVDCKTKSVLNKIDQQLEDLRKLNTLNEFATLVKSEENVSEGMEGESFVGERKNLKKKRNRLEEIDKLLNSVSTTSDKEISPLSEKQMESLIKASMRSLRESKSSSSSEEDTGVEYSPVQLPLEVITELVSDAKLLMPKFKYRFNNA